VQCIVYLRMNYTSIYKVLLCGNILALALKKIVMTGFLTAIYYSTIIPVYIYMCTLLSKIIICIVSLVMLLYESTNPHNIRILFVTRSYRSSCTDHLVASHTHYSLLEYQLCVPTHQLSGGVHEFHWSG